MVWAAAEELCAILNRLLLHYISGNQTRKPGGLQAVLLEKSDSPLLLVVA